ncbi:protein of unknown function [Methylorubrum extorquens DM4]|uniref:Uncharacterized protein n=1 Tax=Methylorubrum extorquens (strain DSM 6343 / CIP 106787 / DM4) TaxID=661410 RepID=A0A2P9HAK7_METED|nr:protein of unknown function [Methylorubrum extorquens DM4]
MVFSYSRVGTTLRVSSSSQPSWVMSGEGLQANGIRKSAVQAVWLPSRKRRQVGRDPSPSSRSISASITATPLRASRSRSLSDRSPS